LKQKFTEPNSKQIACEDACAWINGRRVPTAEDGLKIQAFAKKQEEPSKIDALGWRRNAWSEVSAMMDLR
jgi:hypothetical protein